MSTSPNLFKITSQIHMNPKKVTNSIKKRKMNKMHKDNKKKIIKKK